MIKVVLADGSRLFREGVRHILDKQKYEIVGEFASASQALAQSHDDLDAQLMICDPGNDPVIELAAVKVLKQRAPNLCVIILTEIVESGFLASTLASGADSYLRKDISPEALLYCVEIVLLGEKIFQTLIPVLSDHATNVVQRQPVLLEMPSMPLSMRETQILRCLTKGASNKEIARKLGMRETTVKVHLKSLLRKLNATNRTQAAIRGINNPSLLGSGSAEETTRSDEEYGEADSSSSCSLPVKPQQAIYSTPT